MDNGLKKLLEGNLLKLPSKDFTSRTMQKIHEMPEGWPSNLKIRRWLILSPLTVSSVLAILLAVFCPWGSSGTISWADVQKQLQQVHTMTAMTYYELTIPDWKQVWGSVKIYLKDPGLRRCEIYDSENDLSAINPDPQWIAILTGEPGLGNGLTLHPDSNWAEMWSEPSHTYGQEPSTQILGRLLQQQKLNYALEQWNTIKKITADKTRRIGSQVVNGRSVVGFGFEVPAEKLNLGEWASETVPGKIWVGSDDGVPILIELEYKTGQGENKAHIVTTEIQWNVPVEESLFDLSVPDGWGISRHLNDSIEYTDIGLSSRVTLEIGPEGEASLADAGDVAGLVKTERTTDPGSDPACTGLITIELTPGAAKRLLDYTGEHPQGRLVVNFNRQITVTAKLDAATPTRLSFDITQLKIPMFKMEENYTTIAAVEKNNS